MIKNSAIQPRGFLLLPLLTGMPYGNIRPKTILIEAVKNNKDLSQAKRGGAHILAKKLEVSSVMNSIITLTKNEIKHMTKVIRSLENIEISSEATTAKSISQEEGLLGSFLGLLMKVGLPLNKNVLTKLTKKGFDAISIDSNSTNNSCSYSKENLWIRYDHSDNVKRRN